MIGDWPVEEDEVVHGEIGGGGVAAGAIWGGVERYTFS